MVTSPVALNTAGSLVPSRPAPDSIARRRRAGLAGIVLILALAAPRGAAAAPERPAPQWIGPRDMTDVLAAGKIRSFSRMLARMQVATANQNAFDVTYYDLDLHPNPANSVLTATVRTRASVVAGPVSTLELDFDNTNMTVDAVTCAGGPASFTHASNLLTIALDRPYLTGEMVDVTVAYHGTPLTGGFGDAFTFQTHNGTPLITSLSEPFDARLWWPCKDDPADKADSADIRVSLPSGMVTAGNGVLVESSDNGTTAFRHWKCRHPIATYLVSIASFAYSLVPDTYLPAVGPAMPLQFYLFPESVPTAGVVNQKVKSMIAAYATRYGEYPFLDEKYGEAQFLWGGGMENQTCTSLGVFNETTVAHELAHQWFGDNVTCRDFHHVWLNEGFATYSEALWAESQGGASAYNQSMSLTRYLGSGTIYVPELSSVGRIFSSDLSYRKPAWVLHMLRHIMGDAAFLTALKTYQQQYRGSSAVTEDLQHVCETVSGMPLGWFFQEWIYGEYYPQYQVSWTSAPAGGGYDLALQLHQSQSWQIFKMPVDVRIQVNTGATYDFVVQDSLATQSFVLHVPDAPTPPVVDPGNWILRALIYPTDVAFDRATPGALELRAPSPDPARAETRVTFATPREGRVSLALLDAAGRRIATLSQGRLPAGVHIVGWDGRTAAGETPRSGVYWVLLDFEGVRLTRKLLVLP